ncbi:MAG: hypothetical protein COB98_04990 [Flavobacteriaceae bacterium]|nr:MAG: hypothetical protein COB98_04990 [Flavobacteriaceae bacterium]
MIPTYIEEQVILFKKDITALHNYLETVYETISLQKNKDLNIFTSKPSTYKNKIFSSLKEIKKDLPLFGIPIVVKDNFNTHDFPTTAGTPGLEDFVPKKDASIIRLLKKEGVIIIGKTNMHELAFGITSNNSHFGAVKNPYNTSMFAGGSSGGTAVAVATGIVHIGLGTDTGGSCRIPAALCGVIGFRPTAKRYPSEGIIPLSTTRDTPGIIANTTENIILFDEVITGKKNNEKIDLTDIRIGIPKTYFYDDLSPGVQKISEQTIEKLKKNGITLIEQDIEGIPDLLTESINVVLHETHVSLPKYFQKYAVGYSYEKVTTKIVSPDVKALFDSGTIAKQSSYKNAITIERPKLQLAYKDYFAKHQLDVILYPTTPIEAMPIKGSDDTILLNGKQVPTFPTYIRNMNPGSYAGVPGITIPAGKTTEGLPVGMHLEGNFNSDEKLLKIATLIYQIINK